MEGLLLRDNAKQQLMQIRDVESGVTYLNKVKAIETWAKAEKKDAELQNLIAEQKIRTQRILGGLINDGQERNEIVKQKDGYNKHGMPEGNTIKTLSEIGITAKESSTFKAIASIPDDIFEKEIAEKKEAVNKAVSELTTAGMLIVSKNIKLQKKKEAYSGRINGEKLSSKNIDIFNTEKKFRVIYADPCWSYNDKQETDMLGGAVKHYDTMSIEQLSRLPVNDITERDAVLFLWVTSPILEESFEVIKAWGFKYKASFVWDKIKHNMGHYNSVRHEFLLICTKGSCVPDNKILHDSVISIERTGHSTKPTEFSEIIDTLYGYGDRIELFAREAKKDNWNYWGNEI